MPEFDDPMARPRYTGLATFMRAPYREDLDGVDIGLIGVPFDGGVTNRTGTRHGPREIRNQSSLMRKINQASGIAPFELCRIADLGDAWVQRPFHLESSLDEIAGFYRGVHAAGIVPLSAGGDHSISLPILRAIAAKRPVGMVHFDAHCDTGSNYLGSNYHHGAPFARAVEEGLLDPKRTVQIGIRGGVNDRDVWRFSHESGMRVIYMPGVPRARLAGGDRRGEARGRRRPDLRELRHRQPRPGLRARHRHARDRRLHEPGSAADDPRAARARSGRRATWSRSRRRSTRPA